MEQTSSRKIYISIGIFFVVISIMVSYVLRENTIKTSPRVDKHQPDRSAERLYQMQTTTISGNIIAVGVGIITVKNDKGIVGDVPVAKDVQINNYLDDSPKKSPLKIQTNKHVTLLLRKIGNTYKVVTINYVPTTPPLPTSLLLTTPTLAPKVPTSLERK